MIRYLLGLLVCFSLYGAQSRVIVPSLAAVTNIAVNAASNFQNTNSVYGSFICASWVSYTNSALVLPLTITNLSSVGSSSGVTVGTNGYITLGTSGKYLLNYSLIITGAIGTMVRSAVIDTLGYETAMSGTALNGTNWVSLTGASLYNITTNQLLLHLYTSTTNPYSVLVFGNVHKFAP